MTSLRGVFASLVFVIAAASEAVAQNPDTTGARGGAARVFLDCDECDFDYIRVETPWVAWVRDRAVADVHVLVSRIGTGGGGEQYTLLFLGARSFAGRVDTLQYVAPTTNVEAETRDGLLRTIHLGLVPYAARSPEAARLRVSVARRDEEDERMPRPGDRDPWNAWVFEVGADGSVEREEQLNDRQIEASLEAQRITDRWKFGIAGDAEFIHELTEYEIEDEAGEPVEITATRRFEEYSFGGVVVKSLSAHWGIGAEAAASSSTFQNTRLALRAAPAIEYSLWPYAEATSRQVTLQYSVGISAFEYEEETIYGKFRETRPTQSFVVGYDVTQPWGEGEASLETSGFLDDFKQYRLQFDGEIDIRLFRGFELRVGGNAALIRDQLALVKREATPEEVLLRLRQLRTDYEYRISIGLEYTFGSIFNSVVNPRFGDGPGSILR